MKISELRDKIDEKKAAINPAIKLPTPVSNGVLNGLFSAAKSGASDENKALFQAAEDIIAGPFKGNAAEGIKFVRWAADQPDYKDMQVIPLLEEGKAPELAKMLHAYNPKGFPAQSVAPTQKPEETQTAKITTEPKTQLPEVAGLGVLSPEAYDAAVKKAQEQTVVPEKFQPSPDASTQTTFNDASGFTVEIAYQTALAASRATNEGGPDLEDGIKIGMLADKDIMKVLDEQIAAGGENQEALIAVKNMIDTHFDGQGAYGMGFLKWASVHPDSKNDNLMDFLNGDELYGAAKAFKKEHPRGNIMDELQKSGMALIATKSGGFGEMFEGIMPDMNMDSIGQIIESFFKMIAPVFASIIDMISNTAVTQEQPALEQTGPLIAAGVN